ncbi:hypothetical protein D041_0619A, partial [Vibrio parahaemolyticus EKP-008]
MKQELRKELVALRCR